MKHLSYILKISIMLLLLLFGPSTYSQQANSSLIGTYYWVNSIVLKPSTITGADAGGESITSIANQYFRVISEINEDNVPYAVIEIVEYSGKGENFYLFNVKGGVEAYNRLSPAARSANQYQTAYFKVKSDVVKQNAAKWIPARFAFGLINFPFKFRPQYQRNDFSGAFNFGAGLGLRLPHRESQETTFSFINGYSLSNVNIESPAVRRNETDLQKTNNYSALSISLGFLIENQKVQAGVFTGLDFLSQINQNQFGWYHQAKPWFSIGFGYAIFSNEKPSEKPVTVQP